MPPSLYAQWPYYPDNVGNYRWDGVGSVENSSVKRPELAFAITETVSLLLVLSFACQPHRWRRHRWNGILLSLTAMVKPQIRFHAAPTMEPGTQVLAWQKHRFVTQVWSISILSLLLSAILQGFHISHLHWCWCRSTPCVTLYFLETSYSDQCYRSKCAVSLPLLYFLQDKGPIVWFILKQLAMQK